MKKYNTKRKQFNYTSIIISLYSSLELFVRSLTKGYLISLNEIIPHYIDLPEPIQKNHLDLSCKQMDRIKNLDEFDAITARNQIIVNLNSCISNQGPYHLNTDAFVQNAANFRSNVIKQLFESVGIKDVITHLKNNLDFIEHLKKIHPDVLDWSKMSPQKFQERAFSQLNDMVDRRNEVAHGSPYEIHPQPTETLIDYITSLKAYGVAFYDIVYRSTLPYLAKTGIELGKPTRTHYDDYVFNIEVNVTTIKVGDMVIAKPAKDIYLYLIGEIQSIQVDKDAKIGIKVPFKVNTNQTIYVVPKKAI